MAAGRTYTPIATTTLSSSQSSVTFSSISGYTDLRISINWGAVTAGSGISIRFNSDTGSNYSDTGLWGTGSSAASGRHTSQTSGALSIAIGGTNNPSECVTLVDVMNYANASTYKTYVSRSNNASGSASYPGSEAVVGLWRSTSAITSVTINSGGTLLSGTTITLYGIAAA